MQMNDSQRIRRSKEKVWAALNDPEFAEKMHPGCQNSRFLATDMTPRWDVQGRPRSKPRSAAR